MFRGVLNIEGPLVQLPSTSLFCVSPLAGRPELTLKARPSPRGWSVFKCRFSEASTLPGWLTTLKKAILKTTRKEFKARCLPQPVCDGRCWTERCSLFSKLDGHSSQTPLDKVTWVYMWGPYAVLCASPQESEFQFSRTSQPQGGRFSLAKCHTGLSRVAIEARV